MNYIYLIGPTGTGAAKTRNKDMACAVELITGYHRCTQEEYIQRMREMRALDLPADTPSSPTETNHTTGG